MLEIRDLEITYGAIRAVRGVSLEVREREIVTLGRDRVGVGPRRLPLTLPSPPGREKETGP